MPSAADPGAAPRDRAGAPREAQWWQRGIVYHVYPRSFQDSDGDGVGDLPGITRRLDYLRWLGVDALWISPFYPSPMADFGYDVADYRDVDPLFGSLADFDDLVAAAHASGLRVILDYVPNHTSDRHPWFRESRRSRSSPKRDWYIWRDPAPGGGPPNNWLSNFGGSAWTLDGTTGQYYYHAYLAEQPDLNWRNPAVVEAMLDVLRFWLERGVDGFRIDALRQLVKDAEFRDNRPNPAWRPGQGPYKALLPVYSAEQPETLALLATMRSVADAYGDTLLIGELYVALERLAAYYGSPAAPGCQLPANFHLIATPWRAAEIARLIARYEASLPAHAWPNWVLGNHDKPRVASRVGDAQARIAAMLLITLRGTPTLYYGDELGMRDVPIPPEKVMDPWERNVPGIGLGRDPQRTPMQWDASEGAGFTTGEPWLPLAADHREHNVAVQRDDPDSLLALYRRLIRLRRRESALALGRCEDVRADGQLLGYRRTDGRCRLRVVLNLGDEAAVWPARERVDGDAGGTVLLGTHDDREGEVVRGDVELRPDEGVVLALR